MIKEAIEYIVGLKEPVMNAIDGIDYSDKKLYPIIHNPKASSISMSTLTSLIDYIKSETDTLYEKMVVHVESPTRVTLYSQLDDQRLREYIAEVDAQTPDFQWERYMEHERFCIALQAKFKDDPNSHKALVLQFAGTVEDGTVAQYGDDGVTQKATVKTGIASKADAVVPNPVKLRPYRTFHEVEQPMSNFIFRMKSEREIECALFEADGGAWKNEAMLNIKDYLEKELDGLEGIIVIA